MTPRTWAGLRLSWLGHKTFVSDNVLLERMVLADWLSRLGTEAGFEFEQHGRSGNSFTIGAPTGLHVTAQDAEAPPYLKFVASDPGAQAAIDDLATEAVERVARRDFGGPIWYSTQIVDPGLKLSASFMGSFIERLGNQTRITGWRRLGRDVLLEFREAPSESSDHLIAPKAEVNVHIAAPGPKPGHFASHVAHGVLETVASICTFALGRSVLLPPTVFPANPEAVPELSEKHTDTSVLTLARKSVSLDIFSQLGLPGGIEIFRRERAALMTCSAAMSQDSDLVACILYVVAAECLTTLDVPWRDAKLTKRFIEFFDSLMPTELETMVAHANFEEVFGIRRGSRGARSLRRELLGRIYDFRSGLVHGGLTPTYHGLGSVVENGGIVRRALFSDFAEGAILGYLKSPRSSLIGHPAFEATLALNRLTGAFSRRRSAPGAAPRLKRGR